MRAPVRFPREFSARRLPRNRDETYSSRIRGIPVAQGKGKGVAPERGGRIARKRVSKKRLTKGKLAWKIGYPKLEGDRATKERSLGRGVKLRATRNIRDASGSRSKTCFGGGARLGEKFARADWRKLRVALFFFNEQQLNPKVGRKVVEQLFVRFRDRLANCELFAGISRVAVNKRWTKFIWDGDILSFSQRRPLFFKVRRRGGNRRTVSQSLPPAPRRLPLLLLSPFFALHFARTIRKQSERDRGRVMQFSSSNPSFHG